MTKKKIIILLLAFFLPFFFTYFFLLKKEKKEKSQGAILGYLENKFKKAIDSQIKKKISPTVRITISPSSQPTLSVRPNSSQSDSLPAPTDSSQTDEEGINAPSPTLTPTPTIYIGPTNAVQRVYAHLITQTPTPTPPIVLSRLTVNPKIYSVDISFNTSRVCSSHIFYGEQRNTSIAISRNQPTTSHFYTINLEEGTTYYFKIKLFPSYNSTTLLYESPVYNFRTGEAKRARVTLQTIQVLKDGNSSGPGTFRLYLGVRDPSHPGLVTCCGFLDSFTASDNEVVSINKAFLGGGAQHGTPLTVYMDEDSQANPGMLHFSFDAPLSGPNQNYTKTVTSEEKYGKKFKAIFRIEIFDN